MSKKKVYYTHMKYELTLLLQSAAMILMGGDY